MRCRLGRVVVAAALAAACGGDSPTGDSQAAPRGGTLILLVSGLPAGTDAQIVVAGAGIPHTLGASDTLTGLQPGRYIITAGETSNDTAYFAAVSIEQSIEVVERQTVVASVGYMVASATLSLRLSGVPEGSTAQLTVTGPDSVTRTLTSDAVLRRLRPGSYLITAVPITSGLDVYRPPGFPRTVALAAASAHVEVPVSYELASGRLSISFHGLPAGSSPRGYISSAYPDLTVSSDTVLTGLTPGRYNIYVGPVTVAGRIYATVEQYIAVEVAASRIPTTAAVAYHPPVGRLTIRTTGLPHGTPAKVQMGISWLQEVEVTDVLVKTDVPVGLLDLYPQPVDISTGLYQFREVQPYKAFVVKPDSAAEVTIQYELLTGLVAINVHGLPAGVDANLSMISSQEEARTLTRSQVVRVYRGPGAIAALNVQSRKEGFVANDLHTTFWADTGTTPIPIDIQYTSTGPLNISLATVRVMQQSWRPPDGLALVAGKDAVLSVFVHGDTTNGAQPTIRARLYQHGTLVHTIVLPPPKLGLPSTPLLNNVLGVVSARIPSNYVQPGLGVVVDVDSDNKYDEPNESDNVFPRSQTPLAVRVAPVHPVVVKLVPIAQAGNFLIGDVSSSNASTFLSKTRRMFPLGDVVTSVRATFGVSMPLTPDNSGDSWLQAASEFAALHAVEGGADYYYGVVKTDYRSGIAGVGLVSGRVALGWDAHPSATSVMAHELGHNFGLLHTRCGTTQALDPDFPHGGIIGVAGYDLALNWPYASDTPDFMGYCDNSWISDYGYERIFNAVVIGTPPARLVSPKNPEPGLLIWGRVQNGRPIIEPAFEVHAVPSLPVRAGPHTLEAIADDGTTLLRVTFDGERVDHARSDDQVFAFVVPKSALRQQPLSALRLTSRSGTSELRVSADALADLALATREAGGRTRITAPGRSTRGLLVRDARTQEILAIARGTSAILAAPPSDVDVTWSDGVRSRSRRLIVR